MNNEKNYPTFQCPVFKKCNGCQLQNMTYKKQLDWKQGKVSRILGKFGTISPIVGMKNPLYYRNKTQAAFRIDQRKRLVSGVYQSSTHSVVQNDKCMLEDRISSKIIVKIRELLKSFKLQPYDPRSQRGFLRHVLVKRGFKTGEIMVVLVTPKPTFPSKNNFIKALLEACPNITTIVQNISDVKMDLVLGEKEKVLYGKGYIVDELCGYKFKISPKSFYQVNPAQTQKLYEKAIELADLHNKETVLDAYCGIGTIGIIASKKAANIISVELNKDAIKDAKFNAKLNEVENVYFYNDDASDFMVKLAEDNQPIDVVLMDPPRAGSDRKFIEALVTLSPKRVVYISCNPESQERDLTFLKAQGYNVNSIHPFDMFPYTNHVETVVLMSKIDK